MKYVAFLDILGFKDRIRGLQPEEAKKLIRAFSQTIFDIFKKKNSDKENSNDKIKGYIVSDSVILYSEDDKKDSLEALIKLTREICEKEFIENSILIRGAIEKGEFDKVPAEERLDLEKGLIVGEAYIKAYLVEDSGSVKAMGVILSEDVYEDIKDILNPNITKDIVEEKKDKKYYLLRYINVDFLCKDNLKNFITFITLAKESKWLPHYYNTIYFVIKKENDKKIEEMFVNIENTVYNKLSNKNWNKNWRDIDLFIENAFAEGVINDFKSKFLKHIRKKLIQK
ncbi:hypothetical protein [Dialister invisus]